MVNDAVNYKIYKVTLHTSNCKANENNASLIDVIAVLDDFLCMGPSNFYRKIFFPGIIFIDNTGKHSRYCTTLLIIEFMRNMGILTWVVEGSLWKYK